MPYSHMSLDELARHLGMDARMVRKWAERGRLPGMMVQGKWRFNRAQLLDWLQREMHSFEPTHVSSLEQAMSDGSEDTVLGALVPLEGIDMTLAAKSKPSVLRELVSLAERTGQVWDGPHILEAVEEREALAPTSLPGGFAIPHPRKPLPYSTAEPLVCVARVPSGIPFGAPDGKLTDLFFFVCSHDERAHLCVLARLALMLSTDLPLKLREIEEPPEVLATILEHERAVIAQR